MTQVIGLMSGTSMDGIDAALVEISGRERDLEIRLIRSDTFAYEAQLRELIVRVAHGYALSFEAQAQLDDQIADAFASAAIAIQSENDAPNLIGSHGQTVFHRPPVGNDLGYTVQLGRGDRIAQKTGIPTVSDFRVADIAMGGQGAPLVPRIDLCLLSHPTKTRCVQNIGGMGNVTFLPALEQQTTLGEGVRGWDTGPGNILIDLAVQRFSNGTLTYDRAGEWAAQGTVCAPLIQEWLADEFFEETPPKSTGREYFGEDFLQGCLQSAKAHNLSKADIIATLTAFTGHSIASEYRKFLPVDPDEVLVCGGGSRNPFLRQCLSDALGGTPVLTTDDVGVDADAKEAIAFAVLAYWHQLNVAGNLPVVTGARQETILGRYFSPF